MNPFPIVLSAPSGGGKTTIARELLKRRDDCGYSVSCTTRKPRQGEVDGTDYYFLTRERFRESIDRGEFAEAAEVHGELYGTLRREIDRVTNDGRHVVMDIDVQGARQLARSYPESVLIFILPPSADVLLDRLTGRRTEAAEAVNRRLRSAIDELRAVSMYHYVVINDDLDSVVARVSAIVDAEEARQGRAPMLGNRVEQLIAELKNATVYPGRDPSS